MDTSLFCSTSMSDLGQDLEQNIAAFIQLLTYFDNKNQIYLKIKTIQSKINSLKLTEERLANKQDLDLSIQTINILDQMNIQERKNEIIKIKNQQQQLVDEKKQLQNEQKDIEQNIQSQIQKKSLQKRCKLIQSLINYQFKYIQLIDQHEQSTEKYIQSLQQSLYASNKELQKQKQFQKINSYKNSINSQQDKNKMAQNFSLNNQELKKAQFSLKEELIKRQKIFERQLQKKNQVLKEKQYQIAQLMKSIQKKQLQYNKARNQIEKLKSDIVELNKKMLNIIPQQYQQIDKRNKILFAVNQNIYRSLFNRQISFNLNNEAERKAYEKRVLDMHKNIKFLFQSSVLKQEDQDTLQRKQYLKKVMLEDTEKKNIASKLLFRHDKITRMNFHSYIDLKQNILLLILLKNNIIVGGYTSSAFNPKIPKCFGEAFLFSLTKFEKYPKKPKNVSIIYESQFLIMGNGQLRIKTGQNKIYYKNTSNDSFDYKTKKLSEIYGSDDWTEVESFQLYEIIFQ